MSSCERCHGKESSAVDWKRIFRLGWGVAFALIACSGSPVRGEDVVRVAGTGASLGLLRILSDEFSRQRPDVRINVVANLGSSGAIAAVAENAIDLGVTSRPLHPGELRRDLRVMEFAVTPFVIGVNQEVEVPGVSLAQLAVIYSGENARWPDGTPVRVILRPERDFDTAALRALSPEMDRAVSAAQSRHGLIVAATDQDSADALEKIPGSLGTSSLALITTERRKIRPLAINGAAPSVDGLRTGAYPHVKRLTLVARPSPSPATQAFIAYLRSPEVARMLPRYGALAAPQIP